MWSIAKMGNGGMRESRCTELRQEQIDELNAIFGLNKRGKKKKRELVWESALGACEIGGYQILPLTSSWALRQEGREMQHCVGSYVEMCCKGRARVFSIRDLTGRRLATMSVAINDSYWYLEQVQGVANSDVSTSEEVYYDGERTVTKLDMTDVYYVAYDVVRCYRKAWEEGVLRLIFEAAEAGGRQMSGDSATS